MRAEGRPSLERWQRMRGALDVLLELSSAQQDAWLDANADDDVELKTELKALLTLNADPGTARFLEAKIPAALSEPKLGDLAGQRMGKYVLDSLIGEGGMGTVWKAARDDGHFEGQVAVKLLNAAIRAPEAVHRFMREGRLLAKLSHPNIARLLDAGVSSQGTPFLVLELIDGRAIDHYCDERHLDVRSRVQLFLGVLAAVEHSHMHLVVHRDIKPTNVLVTADGTAKLLDFGIARLADVDAPAGTSPGARTQTLWNGRAMTLQFASPEQLQGQAATTRSDVYGLGVLLYLLLTGRHPTGLGDVLSMAYLAPTLEGKLLRPVDALQAVSPEARAASAVARGTTPEKLRAQLSGDLDNILVKALKLNPAERYASASEFAQDLRAFLEHRPVLARRDSPLYRTAKFIRRHRFGTAASALALGVIVAVGAAAVQKAREARFEADRASAVNAFVRDMFGVGSALGGETVALRSTTVEQLLDSGTKRLEAKDALTREARADLLMTLADMYQGLGQPAKALPLLEQRGMLLAQMPVGSPLGRPEIAARTWVEAAAAAAQAGLRERRDELLARAESMAITLRAQEPALFGRWSYENSARLMNFDKLQAAEAARNAADAFRVVGDSPNLVRSLAQQSFALTRALEYPRAEAALQEAIQVVSGLSPANPELVAQVNAGGGELSYQSFRLRLAVERGRHEVEAIVAAKGGTHPMVAKARIRLARALMRRGELAEGVAEARAAVAIAEATFDRNDHRSLPNAVEQLGQVLAVYGQLDEAATQFTRAAGLYDAKARGGLPVGVAWLGVSRIQTELGNLAAAESAHAKMLSVMDEAAEKIASREIAMATAQLRLAQGRAREAVALLEPILTPIEKDAVIDWGRLDLQSFWATTLTIARDPRAPEALRTFRELIERHGLTDESPLVKARWHEIEAAQRHASDPAAAAEHARTALAIYEERLAPASHLLATLRTSLGAGRTQFP